MVEDVSVVREGFQLLLLQLCLKVREAFVLGALGLSLKRPQRTALRLLRFNPLILMVLYFILSTVHII